MPIYQKCLFLILVLLSAINSHSQELKGKITDNKGISIPYSTIYIKEISLGTTSNIDGLFSIEIPEGTYTVNFRSMGYKKKIETISVKNESPELNIILEEQIQLIKEVRVFGSGEDPAYRIMRKAIGLAPFHLNQVTSYNSEVYLKGTVTFEKVPGLIRRKLKKEGLDIKSGDVYVDESLSSITFEAPDKYTQKVKSINSSFPGNIDFDFIDLLASSLYQDNLEQMISPMASNAFSHYKYVYEDFDYDGSYVVNKIKVIPKRNNKQFYKGYIYIIEDLWCLHSYNLDINIPFGNITIRQIFDEVRPNIWLPVGHNHFIEGGILGLRGNFRFGGSIKYTNLILNSELLATRNRAQPTTEKKDIPEEKIEKPLTKEQEKSTKRKAVVEELLAKDELSNRDMSRLSRMLDKETKTAYKDISGSLEIIDKTKQVIVEDARSTDTIQWAEFRTIPLTTDELQSLNKRDSLININEPDKSDTTETKKPNSYSKYVKPLLFGKRKWNKDKSLFVRYPGILAPKNFGFNAVDGWYFSQRINFHKKFSSGYSLNVKPWAAWAFNRKAFLWEIKSQYTYSPLKRGLLQFDLGHVTSDFNSEYGIKPFLNSVSSLFFKENYARYFDDRYIKVINRIDIANGLVLHTGIEHHSYRQLENSTNFSFFKKDAEYNPNIPSNGEITDESLNDQDNTAIKIKLEYTPRYYYRLQKGVKKMAHSSYPTLWLGYNKGIKNLFGSEADYDYLETGIKQWIKTAEASSFAYEFKGGWFAKNNQVYFSDFYHNNTQSIHFLLEEHRHAFFLPDYYFMSTSDKFFEAHISYKSPFIALKYLPILEKTMWRELVWTSYYSKPGFTNYFEAGYSLIEILFNFNVGVFAGWENWQFNKVGVNLAIEF
jgi:hypothetical protein